MARQYASHPSAHKVTDEQLEQARERAQITQENLREASTADPLEPGWDSRYQAAQDAHRMTARRLEALESLRAAQIERTGARSDLVTNSARLFKEVSDSLTSSRDAISAAAQEHMDSTAKLVLAVNEHNANLKSAHDQFAGMGLRVRDDLIEDGADHDEGCHDSQGVRVSGTDWTPVPADGVAAHALTRVFAVTDGPYNTFVRLGLLWRDYQVTARCDHLEMPDVPELLHPEPAPGVTRKPARAHVILRDKRTHIPAGDDKTPVRI